MLNALVNLTIANAHRRSDNRNALRTERVAQISQGQRAPLLFVLRCIASRI